jgi:hypothetical protein
MKQKYVDLQEEFSVIKGQNLMQTFKNNSEQVEL